MNYKEVNNLLNRITKDNPLLNSFAEDLARKRPASGLYVGGEAFADLIKTKEVLNTIRYDELESELLKEDVFNRSVLILRQIRLMEISPLVLKKDHCDKITANLQTAQDEYKLRMTTILNYKVLSIATSEEIKADVAEKDRLKGLMLKV